MFEARRNQEAFKGYSFKEPKVSWLEIKKAEKFAQKSYENYRQISDDFENDFLEVFATFILFG